MKLKLLAALLAVVSVPYLGVAEDALVEGGRSPDGRYEVRLVRDPNYDPSISASEYLFQVRAAKNTKPLVELAGSGFRSYTIAQGYCTALWDQSSRFVAIKDRDTRHSTELHIVSVLPDETRELHIPDYVQNALGRVDAVTVDSACVSTPKRWDKDNLIVQLYFTAKGRHSYTCDVTLRVYHEKDSEPSLGLEAVTKPKVDE
jgi:hypothetical protein